MQFHTLSVKKIKKETPDCVTVTFDVPMALEETFQFIQGQYLTLRFKNKDQEARRSYSISTSPLDDELSVSVKRVKGGLVSNYIVDDLKEGSRIDVLPPQGKFYTKLNAGQRKTYYLFGAGSGITPLMSILKTILEAEPMSNVNLLYGNRHENNIIFKEQLEELTQRYEGQLFVSHIISQPSKQKQGGLTGLFKKATLNWDGRVGRINKTEVDRFLAENPPHAPECEYFICGPNDMIDVVTGALISTGVDKKHIHAEHFAGATNHGDAAQENTTKPKTAKATIHLNGETLDLVIPAGKTILDVLIAQKYDPPYSCTSGACSTCMAKVLNGKVIMDTCFALDEDEINDGYILTCQSKPITEAVEITYKL